MKLPESRGPLSDALFPLLHQPPGQLPAAVARLTARTVASSGEAPHADDDVQITLFACYALHYQGFDDVSEHWEWHPPLLALRARLERHFERSLRALPGHHEQVTPQELPVALLTLGAPTAGPSLAEHMKRAGTLDHFREFAIHRSLYNVMEADPHSWGLPRLGGKAKCALVEIQADEYGNGIPGRMHSELFQLMMTELGLDCSYGSYIEAIPGISIAVLNALSMFGLHRRLRGALLGNLAISEIGSSHVNRCFSHGLERLGASEAARLFYDEHVEADAVHEQVAAYTMCGGFAAEFPEQAGEVVFGATVTRQLKQASDAVMTTNWASDRSSLREAAPWRQTAAVS